jgi:hypothetical protein
MLNNERKTSFFSSFYPRMRNFPATPGKVE